MNRIPSHIKIYTLTLILLLTGGSGFLYGQSGEFEELRNLVNEAESALSESSTESAEIASKAIVMAGRMKEAADPAMNLRAVSQQEIRAYLILGDAFRAEDNERRAAKYYRQGYTLAGAIEDQVNQELAKAKLASIGKSPTDLNTRLSNLGRQVVEDLEEMVDEGRMDEEIKNSAEDATLSVLDWQARNAERRGNYAQAVRSYQQTLPYYLADGDTMAYRNTCATISGLFTRLGNRAEAEKYRNLSLGEEETQSSEPTEIAVPNAIEDLRDLVEENEAQEAEYAREEAEVQQEAQNYRNEAEALLRSGNVEASLDRLKKANELQEKLARSQRQRQLDSVRNAHFIETQLQEIELLTQQRSLQNQKIAEAKRSRNFLIVASALILAIAGLITYLFFTKRKAHKTLADTFFQLNKAHEDLKVTQTKLVEAEKMASLGQLTAGIAHEINNPVNFISGNLHPLREDLKDLMEILALYEGTIKAKGLEEPFREALASREAVDLDTVKEEITELMSGIEEGASRTSEIVQGLRTFARMDGGEPQHFDLHQGLDSTLALLKNQLADIEVIREYGELGEIEGYPGRINQVLMNLLSNAIQAMPDGGWLQIKTTQENPGEISISIQDTGEGMDQEIQQRIFEPFFTTKDVGKGTGLGLAISLGIIQQHHGNIVVESQVGQGTQIIVRLPVRM